MKRSIPILMYHQITPQIHPKFLPLSVTPNTFSMHMKLLKLQGYHPINLDQLVDNEKGKVKLPHKPIIITIDDCYLDSVEYTVPILQAIGFTAVYFVPTEYIGKKSKWLMPQFGFEFPIINWDIVKFLDSNGMQIGSHSMTHPYLTSLSYENCYYELQGSRKALEDQLGHEVVHLAYPYGCFDDKVKSIVADSGYHSACTTIEKLANVDDDPLALPRINIQGYYTLGDFLSVIHLENKWVQFGIKMVRKIKRFIK